MTINWRNDQYRKGKLVLISYKDSKTSTHTIRLGRVASAGDSRMTVFDVKTHDFIYFENFRSALHLRSNKTAYVFKDLDELADLITGDYEFDMTDQRENKEYYDELKRYLYGE